MFNINKERLKSRLHPVAARMIEKYNLFMPKNECTKTKKRCAFRITSGNYRYESYGDVTPTCCQNKLYQLLAEVHELFAFYHIDYACLYGTHLGQVRHQGLIPWDTDVDLGVPEEQLEKIKRNIVSLKKRFVTFHAWGIRVNYSQKNLLHVDIEIWKRENRQRVFHHDAYVGSRYLPDNIFTEVEIKEFGSIKAKFPKDISILEDIYGKNYNKIGFRKWCKIPERKEVCLTNKVATIHES